MRNEKVDGTNAGPNTRATNGSRSTTEGFILYSLFCLLFSAVTSTVIYFYQLTTPETAMPIVTYRQCVSLSLELFGLGPLRFASDFVPATGSTPNADHSLVISSLWTRLSLYIADTLGLNAQMA